MPFSETHRWATPVTAALTIPTLRRRDHELGAGWHIKEDGSVRICSAAILSCSDDPAGQPATIKALVATVEKEETMKVKSHNGGNPELHTVLRLLVGKRMVYYTVVLFDDFGHKSGVIL